MGKSKKTQEPKVEEVSTIELKDGAKIITYDDGSVVFFPAPIKLSAGDIHDIFGSQDSDDDDDSDDEDSVSIEDMKAALLESGVTKKDLKKMSDEEIEEAYNELDSEEDDDDEDSDDEDEDEDEDDDDSDDEDSDDSDDDDDDAEEVTPETLAESDFEDLEDIIDEHELDIDADDYEEEDVEKLRKEVAKALGITLPKGKKGKK